MRILENHAYVVVKAFYQNKKIRSFLIRMVELLKTCRFTDLKVIEKNPLLDTDLDAVVRVSLRLPGTRRH